MPSLRGSPDATVSFELVSLADSASPHKAITVVEVHA